MIEATCSACGTTNRITDAPPGVKFLMCISCKARIPMPGSTMSDGQLRPAGRELGLELADLPAPKRASPFGSGPPAPSQPLPKGALNLDGDLPAPKAPSRATVNKPMNPAPPAAGPLNLDDFLATSEPDLPAPKARGGRPSELPKGNDDILDLPAPKSSRGVTDLPGPKTSVPGLKAIPATDTDLPTPKGFSDLPAPRGSNIADLPAPKGGGRIDLPTPKGPGSTGLPAPKDGLDLVAPKGFFDDLPQPAKQQQGGAQDVAPLGFFDDLPQVAKNQGSQGLPAPLGFFDDLPQAKGAAPQVPAPKGFFDDLPQAKGAGTQGLTPLAFDDPASPLDMELAAKGPSPSAPAPGSYNELDLSAPSTPPTRYEQNHPRPTPGGGGSATMSGLSGTGGVASITNTPDASLELVDDPRKKKGSTVHKDAPKPTVLTKAPRSKSTTLGIVAVGVLALGAGGFYMYHRHMLAVEREELITAQLDKAKTSLLATDQGHWLRAATAAKKVLGVDETNPDALGIAAEAAFGGAFDEGAADRIPDGRRLIGNALTAGVTGDKIGRAQALNAITMGQIDQAIARLTPMIATAKDGYPAIYLGWAQMAKGDIPAAVEAFDKAAKTNKALEIAALYGRGKAMLAANDFDAARAAFGRILDLSRDHIGAQVGLAAAQPAAKATQQEADLLAVLHRKDIATADPRTIVQAWVLAGNDAAHGARLDAARERYRKALDIDANDLGALSGLAEVEMKDGKLDTALEVISKALGFAKDDARAQIVATELAIKKNRPDDAEERIKALSERKPPLPPLEQSHLLIAKAHLLEAQHKDEEAVDAYVAAAKVAGDLDLVPTMSAVSKLVLMNQKARATELLAALEAKAASEPELALMLGNGYLQSGNNDQAAVWLRRATETQPNDPDAMFLLGKAMAKLGKYDDSIAQLKKAMALDPSRADIGHELARTYEDAGRDADATELYAKLLAAKDVSIELRGRAGRFYARQGKPDLAGAQGTEILKTEPTNPAGLFLRGEGLLAEGKPEEARKLMHNAVAQDPEAQYLDGEARAGEAIIEESGDTKWQETALNDYARAHELEPKMFNPPAGMGRIFFARRDYKKANEVLQAAWALKKGDKDPREAPVALLIAQCAIALGEPKPVIKSWLAAANQIQASAEAYQLLGRVFKDENNAAEAAKALYMATHLAEEDIKSLGRTAPKWLQEAYFDLGQIELNLNDYAKARDAWDKYVGTNPPPSMKLDKVNEKLRTTLKR